MRRLHHLPLLFLPVVNIALAAILEFNETTGLPQCAYECKPLWAAQFDCSSLDGGAAVKCFCAGVGWAQGGSGGSGSGNVWRGCDSACGDWGGGRVREWLGRVCGGVGSGNGSGGNSGGNNSSDGSVGTETGGTGTGGGGNGTQVPPPSGNETDNAGDDETTKDAEDQATKARAWWKKNYPFFVLAFLVVTVPILLYAFAVPIRKWAKRQIIQNRPRRQSNMEQLGSSGVSAGGFVFPRSPGGSAVWAAGGGSGGGGSGAGSRRGSAANALDGPSSSGVFTTEVLPPPQPPQPQDNQVSTRQLSWERRARAQFARGKSFRLKFWRKTREGDEEG